jgi:hypothetical protein
VAADLRTLLAVGLGLALGALLIVSPETVIRAHLAGRAPRDRGGEYGADGAAPAHWRWLVRLVGVAVACVAVYLGVR